MAILNYTELIAFVQERKINHKVVIYNQIAVYDDLFAVSVLDGLVGLARLVLLEIEVREYAVAVDRAVRVLVRMIEHTRADRIDPIAQHST